jgi:hypothetical protein
MPLVHYVKGRNRPRKRIFLAIPTYSGSVGAAFTIGLFESMQFLDAAGIAVDLCIQEGNCHVDDARNAMVREFMKTDCDDMVFIDEDVGFVGENLLKLVTVERDFVAGVYPCKQDEESYPVRVVPGVDLWGAADGCLEVEGVPTGFLRMSRKCILRMMSEFGDRRFHGRGQENESPHVILFERTYEDGVRYSGDYAFCKKWRSLGLPIYCIPELRFTHTGNKAWSGSLADYWRKTNGVTDAEFDSVIETLLAGNADIKTFEKLFMLWDNHWSATPPMLLEAYNRANEKDGDILECGTGLTTIVMACAIKGTIKRIVSLENDETWIGKIAAKLLRYGLLDNVDLRYSPIVGGWYYLAKPIGIIPSLTICDGPERKYGRAGLFELPGLNVDNSVLIMDDTNDPAMLDLAKAFAEKNGKTVDFRGRFTICS